MLGDGCSDFFGSKPVQIVAEPLKLEPAEISHARKAGLLVGRMKTVVGANEEDGKLEPAQKLREHLCQEWKR